MPNGKKTETESIMSSLHCSRRNTSFLLLSTSFEIVLLVCLVLSKNVAKGFPINKKSSTTLSLLPSFANLSASAHSSSSSSYHSTAAERTITRTRLTALPSSDPPFLHPQDNSDERNEKNERGIRLNKVFKATHSRRAADALILTGRVTVNGITVDNKGGRKVIPFVDQIALDGKLVEGWEALNGFVMENSRHQPTTPNPQSTTTTDNIVAPIINTQSFEYVKYWKPRGVVCTTDRSIQGNIIDAILDDGYRPRHRVYPVGRLDKDTSGIILLTSDGRLPNSTLRGKHKQPKVYNVRVERPISDADIQRLRDGVVITTIAQRDNNVRKKLTARTMPCPVQRLGGRTKLQITLIEGRNRQIRKMLGALDHTVVELHRVSFLGMTLDSLNGPGDWMDLDTDELSILQSVLQQQNEHDNNTDDT